MPRVTFLYFHTLYVVPSWSAPPLGVHLGTNVMRVRQQVYTFLLDTRRSYWIHPRTSAPILMWQLNYLGSIVGVLVSTLLAVHCVLYNLICAVLIIWRLYWAWVPIRALGENFQGFLSSARSLIFLSCLPLTGWVEGHPVVHVMTLHVTLTNCPSIVKVSMGPPRGHRTYVQLLAIQVGSCTCGTYGSPATWDTPFIVANNRYRNYI